MITTKQLSSLIAWNKVDKTIKQKEQKKNEK